MPTSNDESDDRCMWPLTVGVVIWTAILIWLLLGGNPQVR